jgi:hypothetical protein
MKPRSQVVAVLFAIAALLLAASSAVAQMQVPIPNNMRVIGGEGSWHADNDFRLYWDVPPLPGGAAVTGVDYQLLDQDGNVRVAAPDLPGWTTGLESLHVPAAPGAYLAQIRLKVYGQIGPWGEAWLRFDNARPASVRPLAPSGWVAAGKPATMQMEHPTDPLPVSGIRGYAVSVEPLDAAAPCAGADRCSVAETDLQGGIEADAFSLAALPEGQYSVHAVAVSGSGMRSTEAGSAIVRVDGTFPSVSLDGVPGGWTNGPLRVSARARDRLSGMLAAGPNGPITTIAIDGAAPRVEPGDLATAVVSGEGRHVIVAYARDAAGNSTEGTAERAVVEIDEGAPTVAFAATQNPDEPERIEATVADSLSGADLRRGSIGIRREGSRQRFESLPTTSSGRRLVAHWDSDAYATGAYEFRITGYDAASNSASSERRANGERMVLTNPVKAPTELIAAFGGKRLRIQDCVRAGQQRRCRQRVIESFEGRPTRRAVPYGRSVPYSGRLTSASGSPLAGVSVEVIEGFTAGSTVAERTTSIRTATDGTFATRLGPGPSRRVEVVFPGNRTLTKATGDAVELDVLSGLRLHASTATARIGGAPVVFSGRLLAADASLPASGRPIELQFRFPGTEWSEFRAVRADRRGHFHYAYRFSDDDSRGIRFQFRAYAPAEDDWPYEPATSRPVFVTGQ